MTGGSIARFTAAAALAIIIGCDDTRTNPPNPTPPAPAPGDAKGPAHLDYVMPAEAVDDGHVIALEQKLAETPDDIRTRVDLLYHYAYKLNDKDKHRHLLWLIEHAPRAKVLAMHIARIDPLFDKPAFDKAASLWRGHAAAHPKDARILGHAGLLLDKADTDESARLLERAVLLDESPDKARWLEELAAVYYDAAARTDGQAQRDLAAKAVDRYERSLAAERAFQDRAELLAQLGRAARLAGNARVVASAGRRLLVEAKEKSSDTDRAVAGYEAHCLLGHAALMSDGHAEADAALAAAAATLEPVGAAGPLWTFDVSFADAMLERGRRDGVLRLLKALSRAATHSDPCRQWIEQIEAGQSPRLRHGGDAP